MRYEGSAGGLLLDVSFPNVPASNRDPIPENHTGLIGDFGRRFVKTGKVDRKFSTMLLHAEFLRESADYEIESEIKSEDAGKVVEKRERFFSRCRRSRLPID